MKSDATLAEHNRLALTDLRINLKSYRASGDIVREVEISACDDACPACTALSARRFTVEDALRTNPLPCRNCTGGWKGGPVGACRCCYLPIVNRR